MRLDVEARTGCTAAAEIITQLNKEKNIYNIKNKNEKKTWDDIYCKQRGWRTG